MERLKNIKEALISCAENQMNHLSDVDARELGEVIDMIKDLEETIYYCTITKSMDKAADEKESGGIFASRYYPERDMDRTNGRLYYAPSGSSRYYSEPSSGEGRSGMSRKMYMEGKEKHQDKSQQLQELEKYMTELTSDLAEMIEDSSPEEKQYLERRLSHLAQKISNV